MLLLILECRQRKIPTIPLTCGNQSAYIRVVYRREYCFSIFSSIQVNVEVIIEREYIDLTRVTTYQFFLMVMLNSINTGVKWNNNDHGISPDGRTLIVSSVDKDIYRENQGRFVQFAQEYLMWNSILKPPKTRLWRGLNSVIR